MLKFKRYNEIKDTLYCTLYRRKNTMCVTTYKTFFLPYYRHTYTQNKAKKINGQDNTKKLNEEKEIFLTRVSCFMFNLNFLYKKNKGLHKRAYISREKIPRKSNELA